jgi:hypothetical protein
MKAITVSTFSLAILAANASAQNAGESAKSNAIQAPAVTLKPEPEPEPGFNGRRFGVGLLLGEPVGASFKYWLTQQSALDAGIGWSIEGHDDFEFHADYLYHLFDVIPVDRGSLPVYFGGGLRVKVRDHEDDFFGFRAVAGLDYLFAKQPIDIFLEAGPVFDVTPDFEVRFTAAVGARYWF